MFYYWGSRELEIENCSKTFIEKIKKQIEERG